MAGKIIIGSGLTAQQRAQAQKVLDQIKEEITTAQGVYTYLKPKGQAAVGLVMLSLMDKYMRTVKEAEQENRQGRIR